MSRCVELWCVDTGNGGPDLWRDADGFARWSDGRRLTNDDLLDDDAGELVWHCVQNDLAVEPGESSLSDLDEDDESLSQSIAREEVRP